MNKFKVGDKLVGVELEDKYGTLALHCWLVPNKVYTVSDVKRSLVFIRTALNEPLRWWAEEWFKLADEQILSNAFDKAVEEVGETFVAKSLIEKEIEMTAEQIRNEILRIDVRIEEAKKDIENAETERSVLVEKLREKGFSLTMNPQPIVRYSKGDKLIVVGNTTLHRFPNGTVVTVIEDGGNYYDCKDRGGMVWSCHDADVVKFK